jgi:hypothetical protein
VAVVVGSGPRVKVVIGVCVAADHVGVYNSG